VTGTDLSPQLADPTVPVPTGRYPYLANAGRQRDQLYRLLAWEDGYQFTNVDRDPDVLEQLVDAGYASWSTMGYSLTDRGRKIALQFLALDDAAEPTEQFDAVPAEPNPEPVAEATLTGRHRVVRKSRWAWLRDRLTLARVAALSASAGVLVGVGFMWLVTR